MFSNKSKFSILFFSFFTFLLWSAPLFTTPTFDLDEALYRQSAQEMKQSHNYFKITWSGKLYYDKPPTHIWSMLLASKVFDKDENSVSVFTAKLPSTLATYFTIICACIFWSKSFPFLKRRLEDITKTSFEHEWLGHPVLPGLFFGWTLLPTAGSSSVIIDPMLLAAFSPFFLSLSYYYIKDDGILKSIPSKIKLLMIFSMLASCMLKGPIGLLLPFWSVIFHEILSFLFQRKLSTKNFFLNRFIPYLKLFFPIFFIALILSAVYYLLIYIYGGKDFIINFFLVQNIERGLRPFEGHGGSFFYHWIVVFCGGTFLTPILVYLLLKVLKKPELRWKYGFWGYPLSWSISIILFYCFMATKLPNYTWPVWIGFSTAAPILLSLSATMTSQKNNKAHYLLFFTPILLCLTLFSGAQLFIFGVNHLHLDPRVKIVMDTILPIPSNVKLALIFSASILALSIFYCFQFLKQGIDKLKLILGVAFLNSLFIFTICFGVVPFIKNVYWQPFVRNSEYVEQQIQKEGGKFATVGLHSPTVSSSFHLFYIPQFSKGDTTPFEQKINYILLPKWIEENCKKYGYNVVKRDYYLSVCKIAK